MSFFIKDGELLDKYGKRLKIKSGNNLIVNQYIMQRI